KSRTVDEIARGHRAGLGLEDERAAIPADGPDARPRLHLGAPLADEGGHALGDLGVVDDAGRRREHAPHRADMWLPLADLVAGDQLEPGDAVGGAALMERIEARDLLVARGHDDLAA